MTGRREVPLNSLAPGVEAIRPELDAAIDRVLRRGWFLLGPETEAFEQAFAAYHGPEFQCAGVGSGTDALRIGLQALGVQTGDEVLVVANAGVPPVAAVVAAGARPAFCDVDPDTQTLDAAEIERRAGPRARAVLVVHLYGRTANMEDVLAQARSRGLVVLEDCAQAHGARRQGRLAGVWGDAAAFSFYPTKNLGAAGDGGMVVTNDARLATRLRSLRVHGGQRRYYHDEVGVNSRLDEIQAAILRVKLERLEDWNLERRRHAAYYDGVLAPAVRVPAAAPEGSHIYHQYVIRVPDRDELRRSLAERGIETAIYYPVPLHRQKCFAYLGYSTGDFPEAEAAAREVLSLPMHADLTDEAREYVAGAVLQAQCQELRN